MEKMLAELTIKMPIELRRQLVGVADADGVPASQYVRDLIILDLQTRRRKFNALSSIFSVASEDHQELPSVSQSDEAQS